ncbi:SPOR domain-containing protein [Motilimonas pumila]|uniref:Sporulation protein n=1 Tax=Motilimonas pumila TaxID=2303987 RepID=A0A418YCW2_9GAMM|nr:SPOR domain-containing protein [Motilimonas pumila]RJG42363.1 sporulation protein [Motilimonas pumila]
MARDYVRNKPTKKGASSRKRGPAKSAPKAKFPVVASVVAAAALGGFGYFLYTISGSAEQTEIAQPTPSSNITNSKPKEKPLPDKPKEKWDYIQELENKEVVVEVPPDPPPAVPYQMQCGSFRTLDQAEALKANIAFQGVESIIRKVNGKTGVWYKVILGPYERKRMAEKERHKMKRANINYCQIWKWQGPLP